MPPATEDKKPPFDPVKVAREPILEPANEVKDEPAEANPSQRAFPAENMFALLVIALGID